MESSRRIFQRLPSRAWWPPVASAKLAIARLDGDNYRTLALSRLSWSSNQLRPAIQRSIAFAGLELGELGGNRVAFAPGKCAPAST